MFINVNNLNWYFPHLELPGVLNARKVPCRWSSQGTEGQVHMLYKNKLY
jgi:hypothetical protein